MRFLHSLRSVEMTPCHFERSPKGEVEKSKNETI